MKRILIIEDDHLVATIYANKYTLAGFNVRIAADGAEGIELLKTFKPDLVQLDLQVPKVNGVEIAKFVRSHAELSSIPVIVLSNCYISGLVKEAWAAGATKCLSKQDCTPNLMLDIVTSVLNRSASGEGASGAAGPGSASATEPEADTTFQEEIRRAFLARSPAVCAVLRQQMKALARAEAKDAQMSGLFELCRSMHSLAGNSALAAFHQVARMSSALEALLKKLFEKPRHITASSLRTLAHGIDVLFILFEHDASPETPSGAPAIGLVVDDEILSRRAVSTALAKVNIAAISVDHPDLAVKLLRENRFSLIFLDVEMPAMNGFDLCNQLRALPGSKSTPVVFVTSLTDFECRTRSAMSGGNDLIAKPFLLMELAVKALSYVLKQTSPISPKQDAANPLRPPQVRPAAASGENVAPTVPSSKQSGSFATP